MATFGIGSAGFVIKTLDDIRTSLRERAAIEFGPDFNTDDDSVAGQLIDVFAQEIAEVWELAQQASDSLDPDQAVGTFLDNLLGLSQIIRNDATTSLVDITFTGDAFSVIPAGTQVQHEVTNEVFETSEDTTLNGVFLNTGVSSFTAATSVVSRTVGTWEGDGVTVGTEVLFAGTVSNNLTATVVAVLSPTDIEVAEILVDEVVFPLASISRGVAPAFSLNSGAIDGSAFTVNQIVTPVVGLNSAINLEDAQLGTEIETDDEYRARFARSASGAGTNTDQAMLADILDIDRVEFALVRSNRNSIVVDGIDPNHVSVVVYPDGDASYYLEIAEVIFANVPSGIDMMGATIFDVTDSEGFTQQVRFDIATEIDIYVTANITVNGSYPVLGDDLVAAAILAYGNDLSVGDDVINWELICALQNIPGIETISMLVDDVSPPLTSANYVVPYNEIAVFDSTRIVVNQV